MTYITNKLHYSNSMYNVRNRNIQLLKKKYTYNLLKQTFPYPVYTMCCSCPGIVACPPAEEVVT